MEVPNAGSGLTIDEVRMGLANFSLIPSAVAATLIITVSYLADVGFPSVIIYSPERVDRAANADSQPVFRPQNVAAPLEFARAVSATRRNWI